MGLSDIDSIPKYVRYDFFMSLIGLATLVLMFTNDRIYLDADLRLAFFVAGGLCLGYGIVQMKQNYETESRLQTIRDAVEEKRLWAESRELDATLNSPVHPQMRK